MKRPVIILGAGGHARVLIDALLATSREISGIVDPDPALKGARILGLPVLGGDEVVTQFPPADVLLVNGLGSVGSPVRRQKIFERFKGMGYSFISVVHPSAVVATQVELGEGGQIMAGAVIQTGSRIGANVIINTRVSVDHDCMIGDHCHLAPGVTLSGGVKIGSGCHLGTAATVIQGITIGEGTVVGAGSLVLKDVAAALTVYGSPAGIGHR